MQSQGAFDVVIRMMGQTSSIVDLNLLGIKRYGYIGEEKGFEALTILDFGSFSGFAWSENEPSSNGASIS